MAARASERCAGQRAMAGVALRSPFFCDILGKGAILALEAQPDTRAESHGLEGRRAAPGPARR
jgi:hypothetical protein